VSIPFVLLTVVPAYPGRPGLHLDFAYRLSEFAYRRASRVGAAVTNWQELRDEAAAYPRCDLCQAYAGLVADLAAAREAAAEATR
jgi:hypothetical protein